MKGRRRIREKISTDYLAEKLAALASEISELKKKNDDSTIVPNPSEVHKYNKLAEHGLDGLSIAGMLCDLVRTSVVRDTEEEILQDLNSLLWINSMGIGSVD